MMFQDQDKFVTTVLNSAGKYRAATPGGVDRDIEALASGEARTGPAAAIGGGPSLVAAATATATTAATGDGREDADRAAHATAGEACRRWEAAHVKRHIARELAHAVARARRRLCASAL